MPAPKSFSAYPFEFTEVMEALHETPTVPVKVYCDTEREAKRLRLLFYGYKKALLDNNKLADLPHMNLFNIEDIAVEIVPDCTELDNIECGHVLFYHRSHSPTVMAIREALESRRKAIAAKNPIDKIN